MDIIKDKKIYKFEGILGIRDLYKLIINHWQPKDFYCIVSAPLESFEKLEKFFLETVHTKRVKDKVILKIIINDNAQSFGFVRKNMPYTQVKFLNIDTTAEYGVLNDILFIVNYAQKPYGVLIKDANLANTFLDYFNILWNQGRKINIPPLVKSNASAVSIINKYKNKNPIIITDSFNYNYLRSTGFDIVYVKNNDYKYINQINNKIKKNKHQVIVGIGGCTALDMARACSKENLPSILIPTILSTVCISVNKAVIKHKNEVKVLNTESPQKVIFSAPAVLKTKRGDLVKWSRAGFGDLFAKIGASIDVVYRKSLTNKDTLSLDKIRRNIPEVFDAIEYVLDHFNNYSKKDLEALAIFLHEASVSIIIRDTFELSGGAEHDLAYAIEEKFFSGKSTKPSHGTIVSVGSLIEFKLFSEITGDKSLYHKMRRIYEKLGLPTTYKSLEKIGLKKEQIIYGLKSIHKLNTFLSANYKLATKLIDEIFN